MKAFCQPRAQRTQLNKGGEGLQITGAQVSLLIICRYAFVLDSANRWRELTVCEDGAEGVVSQFKQILGGMDMFQRNTEY